MGRKIILLSDGTGNSSAKVWRTNVWRTFEALDLSGNDQVAYYDDGVGTSSFKPMAILGGAFGFGLRRNVLTLYKFACRNYRDADDELFGFGFSRGAFTIRIVMGLIANQGIIKADNETELHSLASAAYRAYRKARYENLRLERPYQFIRNMFGPAYPPSAGKKIDVEKIHFIGVWDTVSAYGMPIKEMNDGIHKYLWPIELPDGVLNGKVQHAIQALALDEERTTFHPQLWREPNDNRAACPQDDLPGETTDVERLQDRFIKDERISQVWFSGVHSNVGGGYPDDSLAYIPFVWMITQARRCGLNFKSDFSYLLPAPPPSGATIADPDTFKSAISKRDKDGRLYDPRKGLGGYYRYGPRKLTPDFYPESKKGESDEVDVGRAKIHESVFKRIKNHAHSYAPIGLPPFYDVVTDAGEVLPLDRFKIAPDNRAFEDSDRAGERATAQEHVWNDVWWRRAVYFMSVAATAWLLIFPLVRDAQRVDELTSRFRWISDILRVVQGFLPTHARFWFDGYAREPGLFLFSILLVGALLKVGAMIAAKANGKMSAIWLKSPGAPRGRPTGPLYAIRSSAVYGNTLVALKSHIAPVIFAIMFSYLAVAITSHLLFNIQDVGGATCRETPPEQRVNLPVDANTWVPLAKHFETRTFCHATGVMLKAGERYVITIKPKEAWLDSKIPVTPGNSPTENVGWIGKALFHAAVPLRRDLFEEWFKIVVRYGRIGGEEAFYEPDPTDPIIGFPLQPTRDGELFIFVNDAVIGFPWLYDRFYRNNSGTAEIALKRTK